MPRYKQHQPGEDGWSEWIQPVEEGYNIACCDCGLVHQADFRVHEGRIQFRVRRHNRATGQVRRRMRRER